MQKAHSKVLKNMNQVEQAEHVQTLSGKYSQKEIAEKLDISVPQVSNLMTIAALPLKMKKRIARNEVSATLVLQVIRDNKDISEAEACDLIEDAFIAKGGQDAITKKDINKMIKRFNSFSIVKKIVKQYGPTSVKKNETEFEVIRGIVLGKLDRPTLLKRYGLAS